MIYLFFLMRILRTLNGGEKKINYIDLTGLEISSESCLVSNG